MVPGFTGGQIDCTPTGNLAQLQLEGPGNNTAGHTDFTQIAMNSSDGSSSANMWLIYDQPGGAVHVYGAVDCNGFNVGTGAITGIHPGTYSPASPAVAETWQNVGMGSSGLSGTLRIKRLAEQKFALIHAAITFTYTAAAQTFNLGSLPSAAYYPTAGQGYPVAVNATPSGIVSSDPRLYVPTSGAVQLIVPSGSGSAAVAGGTVVLPLD